MRAESSAASTQKGPGCRHAARAFLCAPLAEIRYQPVSCLILSVASTGATVKLFATLVLCTVLLPRGSQQKRDAAGGYIPLGVSQIWRLMLVRPIGHNRHRISFPFAQCLVPAQSLAQKRD